MITTIAFEQNNAKYTMSFDDDYVYVEERDGDIILWPNKHSELGGFVMPYPKPPKGVKYDVRRCQDLEFRGLVLGVVIFDAVLLDA